MVWISDVNQGLPAESRYIPSMTQNDSQLKGAPSLFDKAMKAYPTLLALFLLWLFF